MKNRMDQQRLMDKPIVKYSYGPYNKMDDIQQWIRITEGCPHNCPYCYEPTEIKIFPVPLILRNIVKIMDMNMLCKTEAIDILKSLPERVNGNIVRYEFVCGIDYRFLTEAIAREMKNKHFERIRIAWDWYMKDQYKIKDALKILYSVGYAPIDVIVFMICNWEISYKECLRKLEVCKVWNVKVADCYYDNQINITKRFIPIGWTTKNARDFRRRVRRHNMLVNFKIDPLVKSKEIRK